MQNEALFDDSLSMSAKGLYALIAARIDYTAVPLTKQWLMNTALRASAPLTAHGIC